MDRLTSQQVEEYYEAFCEFDKHDLGYILATNMRDMLKSIGFNPRADVLEKLSKSE